MIKKETLEEAVFKAIAKGSTTIAPDVCAAFEAAIGKESRPAAREGLQKTYDSIKLSDISKFPVWTASFGRFITKCRVRSGTVTKLPRSSVSLTSTASIWTSLSL